MTFDLQTRTVGGSGAPFCYVAIMDKDAILEAVIAIGDAVKAAKRERQRAEREEQDREHRCDVGHPVGTKLFAFCYEGGVEEIEVVDKQRVRVDGRRVRYCMKHDVFAETVEGAIRAAVESWESSGDLNIEEDIKHFEYDLKYHGERIEWATIALKNIRERLAT